VQQTVDRLKGLRVPVFETTPALSPGGEDAHTHPVPVSPAMHARRYALKPREVARRWGIASATNRQQTGPPRQFCARSAIGARAVRGRQLAHEFALNLRSASSRPPFTSGHGSTRRPQTRRSNSPTNGSRMVSPASLLKMKPATGCLDNHAELSVRSNRLSSMSPDSTARLSGHARHPRRRRARHPRPAVPPPPPPPCPHPRAAVPATPAAAVPATAAVKPPPRETPRPRESLPVESAPWNPPPP